MSNFRYGGNVQANGIRQHYLRYGGERAGRDPVIIVPGITSPAVTWGFVGERFGEQFDTYILDVRGRGLSQSGPQLDYGLDVQAEDLLAFARALGLSRYSVVGHSMGARIGIRAARTGEAGLARLAMVDPPVSGPGRRAYPSKLPWYVDSMAQARQGMTGEQMKRTVLPELDGRAAAAARRVAAHVRGAGGDRQLRGVSRGRRARGPAAGAGGAAADDGRAARWCSMRTWPRSRRWRRARCTCGWRARGT
ncbi:alpha/beta fold hydrolase [Bordetella pertussis]|uniref:alpha/beta fold hydrolase n=1 Tax=Bordetella pertussis TaxID=520 RepID=UPI0039B756D5